MTELEKVLVVDSGARGANGALSAELAGMGYASITTPFEAADEVLALIPSPVAVVLKMPDSATSAEQAGFCLLAERMRVSLHASNVPVIVLNEREGRMGFLQSKLAAHAGGFRIPA